jgi:hypothetical protein
MSADPAPKPPTVLYDREGKKLCSLELERSRLTLGRDLLPSPATVEAKTEANRNGD